MLVGEVSSVASCLLLRASCFLPFFLLPAYCLLPTAFCLTGAPAGIRTPNQQIMRRFEGHQQGETKPDNPVFTESAAVKVRYIWSRLSTPSRHNRAILVSDERDVRIRGLWSKRILNNNSRSRSLALRRGKSDRACWRRSRIQWRSRIFV